MEIKIKAAAYGVVGLALAAVMIFSGATLGVLGPTGALNVGSPGSVSILLTDPPTVPEGVSAVYISYSNLALHLTTLGDSGWVNVEGHGTIDTMGLVNLSQTISTGNVPSGRYNLLEFNITSAKVKFLGTNYSATVNSGKLMVPIIGGLEVNSSTTAAALVDIQPTVLNLGNASNPNFVITTGAKALQLPQGEVVQSLKHVGHQSSMEGQDWFHSFVSNHSDNLTISGLSLSTHSFSFSASNPGTDSIVIRMVILTATSPGERSGSALASVGNSVVFAVGSDGSLHLLGAGSMNSNHGEGNENDAVDSVLSSDGYQLTGGASATFTYSGTIASMMSSGGILSGATYYVVIMGSHTLALETVKSS
ncbi:MAG: hypothetical protein ACHQYR_03520 [Candidatus Gagatemarchaeaceae archaeon]